MLIVVLGVLLSGGTDKLINIWDYRQGGSGLCGSLIGHNQNVCKLVTFPEEKRSFPFVCGSTSWDGTARCWTEELSPASCLTLSAEEAGSCWSIAALGRDSFVTAHADKSIRIWRGDVQAEVIHAAHSDVVRDLIALEPDCFISVGNDGAVKVWEASHGALLQTITCAHPAFIYGLVGDGKDQIATFGEEGIVKIWKWNSETRQLQAKGQLRVPMMSVWCATFIGPELLLVGGSSGSFYIFSSEDGNGAPAISEVFNSEMVAFDATSMARKSSEIEKNLQEETVLKYPGESVGKTVIVRRNSIIEAHQWDGAEWNNLGEVIDPNSVKAPDFNFKVEMDETGRSFDLPYSWGENPYSVAKNFLERNDLPISHLDEVANFIVKNAGNPPPSSTASAANESKFSQVPAEPENLVIEAFNYEGVLNKLKSFGFKHSEDSESISFDDIQGLLKTWPIEKLFPCLDWLRVYVLKDCETSEVLANVPFDGILEIGTKSDVNKESVAAVTMSLRLLCNISSKFQTGLIDDNLVVKMIGKCSQSAAMQSNSNAWLPLLIGILYNCRNRLDAVKKMALLDGILSKSYAFRFGSEEVSRIYWLVKGSGQPVPLTTSLKKGIDRISDLKVIESLLQ